MTNKLMKIMEDIYFCENVSLLKTSEQKLKDENITHIVAACPLDFLKTRFNVLTITFNEEPVESVAYRLCPRVSDMLREVLLLKGKLLFVNDESNYATNLLVFTLSYWFRCSVYETWCLINTQILSFPAFTFDLIKMSKVLHCLNSIEK